MLCTPATTATRVPRAPARALALVRTGARRNFGVSAPRGHQHLVILGSGWGGYELLRGIDKKRWREFVLPCCVRVLTGRAQM